MKKLSVLGIVVGAALLSVAPVSIQPSPRNLVELSVNKAEALVYRRHYRRAYRSAYYGGYGHGVYYGGGYYSGSVCPHLGMDWGKGAPPLAC
jgi:hypothetical protein